MSTINFRIKKYERTYFYYGDDILVHMDWTAVETLDLSEPSKGNLLTALDHEYIESDIPLSQVKEILGTGGEVIIVPDIPARDAISPVYNGLLALVQDIGDGTWAKYQYDNGSWVMISNEGGATPTRFTDLEDVDIAYSVGVDGYFAMYNNTSGKMVLSEIDVPTELTAADIKSLYESNSNTNAFTDAEQTKLFGIETGAKAHFDASEITYRISSDVELEIDDLKSDKSDINHNHDGVYSFTSHNHDGVYSFSSHEHDTRYSVIDHNHDGIYSFIDHNHDGVYSFISHNHDGVYADYVHNHDAHNDTLYSGINHNHDGIYSFSGHNHDGVYEPFIPTPVINNQVLVRNTNGVYYYYSLDTLNFREVDDVTTATDTTYSSIKMENLLLGKSGVSHIHDDRYYTQPQVDSLLDTWKGEWVSTYPYKVNQEVQYLGSTYIALLDNTNKNPADNTSEWDLKAAKGDSEEGPGVAPGGYTGNVLVKASDDDYDTEWVPQDSVGPIDAILQLNVGLTIPQRLVGATIPNGWDAQSADNAGIPNLGSDPDTLVVIHDTGRMVVEASVWETANASNPDIVQGSTRIKLDTQGQVKNSLDQNSFSFDNLQPLTNPSRTLYIHMVLL